MSKNNICDLLALNVNQLPALARKEFFGRAWKRLEKGQSCHTQLGADGSLIQCGWLIERFEDALPGDAPSGVEAAGSAILVVPEPDLFPRDASLLGQCVKHMLAEANLLPSVTDVYISLDPRDSIAISVIETLGFELNPGTERAPLSRKEEARVPKRRAAEIELQARAEPEEVV